MEDMEEHSANQDLDILVKNNIWKTRRLWKPHTKPALVLHVSISYQISVAEFRICSIPRHNSYDFRAQTFSFSSKSNKTQKLSQLDRCSMIIGGYYKITVLSTDSIFYPFT